MQWGGCCCTSVRTFARTRGGRGEGLHGEPGARAGEVGRAGWGSREGPRCPAAAPGMQAASELPWPYGPPPLSPPAPGLMPAQWQGTGAWRGTATTPEGLEGGSASCHAPGEHPDTAEAGPFLQHRKTWDQPQGGSSGRLTPGICSFFLSFSSFLIFLLKRQTSLGPPGQVTGTAKALHSP